MRRTLADQAQHNDMNAALPHHLRPFYIRLSTGTQGKSHHTRQTDVKTLLPVLLIARQYCAAVVVIIALSSSSSVIVVASLPCHYQL
jgi:hypothetical protein